MGAFGTAEGSLAVAIAAMLVVLGFRLARPERGREWLAVAAYAAALAVQVFGAHGLLPGRVLAPALATRVAGAALLVAGVLVAGGPARARRRAARARGASTASATSTPTSTSPPTSTPALYAGLALVVVGQLLRGPSAAGAVATAVAVVACGLAALAVRAPRRPRGPGSPPSGRAGAPAPGARRPRG